MLKEVVIEQFRSCSNVRIRNIGGILALLGRNGTGKTNILLAIRWAAESAVSDKPLASDVASRSATIEAELGGKVFRYRVRGPRLPFRRREHREPAVPLAETIEVRPNVGGAWSVLVEREGEVVRLPSGPELKIGQAAPSMPVLASLFTDKEAINVELQPLRTFLKGIRYYPLDEPFEPLDESDKSAVVDEDEYRAWASQLKATGEPGTSVVRRIVEMALEHHEQFDEFKSLLGPDGLGLIDEVTVHPFPFQSEGKDAKPRTYYFVWFKPTGGGPDEFTFSQLSIGTRRVIRILVSILFDGSTVLLMEQPEDAIHCALMKKLTGLLKSNVDPTQFMVATHSSDVFNKLSPDEVRLVSMRDGQTSLRPLTASEQAAACKFMEQEGSFADFLESIAEN